MMLSEEQIRELERLQWIKDQLPLFDSDLMTGKVTEEEYHKEMQYFIDEISLLEEKYQVTDLDELRKEPLKNMGKIWRMVGRIPTTTEDDFNEAIHNAIDEVGGGIFN